MISRLRSFCLPNCWSVFLKQVTRSYQSLFSRMCAAFLRPQFNSRLVSGPVPTPSLKRSGTRSVLPCAVPYPSVEGIFAGHRQRPADRDHRIAKRWVNRLVCLFNFFEFRALYPHACTDKLLNLLCKTSCSRLSPEQIDMCDSLLGQISEWCSTPPVFPEGGARGTKVLHTIIQHALQESGYGGLVGLTSAVDALNVDPDRVDLPDAPGLCDPMAHLPHARAAERLEQPRPLEPWLWP